MDRKSAVLIGVLILCSIVYGIFWVTTARRKRREGIHGADEPVRPTALQVGIGFVTNFFDTLGIGSYATTTAMFRAWGLVRDEQIPGTLNVGQALPTIMQAVIYVQLIEVEFWTLFLMVAAAAAGAWLGAGVVAGLPRRRVQIGMGLALLGAATIMFLQVSGLVPGGGTASELHGIKLVVAVAGNSVLGALMTLGIGLYAPCMILISLLGMSAKVAFPIMMGSCGFLVLSCSPRFVRKNRYNLRAAVGLTIGGPPAVLIAAFIVRSLPLFYLRWLVVGVVVYTSMMMLRAAAAERKPAPVAAAALTDLA
jgi:uncharacterized membrane protein YfcA